MNQRPVQYPPNVQWQQQPPPPPQQQQWQPNAYGNNLTETFSLQLMTSRDKK
jgi:hypothetical protein